MKLIELVLASKYFFNSITKSTNRLAKTPLLIASKKEFGSHSKINHLSNKLITYVNPNVTTHDQNKNLIVLIVFFFQ